MGQSSYKRLGDYIEAIDERNSDLSITLSQGISNNKCFQEPKQVATNSVNDKIVRTGYFAYNRATTRNGEKISIALREGDDCTVSSAYQVFRVLDEDVLLSKYLLLWFQRPVFDRYARFKSHGSAHEFFDWEEMCEVRLPIPAIEEQREIVAQYEAITRRIALNERICANLEETAQALYNKMFVQGIDPDNLPDGWRMGVFEDFATVSGGKACTIDKSATKTEEYRYPIAGATGVIGYSSDYNSKGKSLTIGRVGSLGVVNRYDGPVYMADNVLVITSKHYHFCEQTLKSINYEEIKEGGVQGLITQKELKKVEVLLPERNEIENYEASVRPLYERIDLIERQNTLLTTLLSILVLSIS